MYVYMYVCTYMYTKTYTHIRSQQIHIISQRNSKYQMLQGMQDIQTCICKTYIHVDVPTRTYMPIHLHMHVHISCMYESVHTEM